MAANAPQSSGSWKKFWEGVGIAVVAGLILWLLGAFGKAGWEYIAEGFGASDVTQTSDVTQEPTTPPPPPPEIPPPPVTTTSSIPLPPCPASMAEAATMLGVDPDHLLNLGCGYQVKDPGLAVTLPAGVCAEVDMAYQDTLTEPHDVIGPYRDFIRIRMTGAGTVSSPVTVRWNISCDRVP